MRNEGVWLKNFGTVGNVSQQTNLFIKPDLMQRYEKAFFRVREKYGEEKLRNFKKSHLNEQSKGNFSDHKSIKVPVIRLKFY